MGSLWAPKGPLSWDPIPTPIWSRSGVTKGVPPEAVELPLGILLSPNGMPSTRPISIVFRARLYEFRVFQALFICMSFLNFNFILGGTMDH